MIALLDTHQHLIYPDQAGYAWTDDKPLLARQAFTLGDYKALTEGKGVGATIFMEADADDYQAEARFVGRPRGEP